MSSSDRSNKARRLIEALEDVKLLCAQAALRAEEYERIVEQENKLETEKQQGGPLK